jgi:hypothetical protein
MIARQAVELPHHDGVEPAPLGGVSHLLEAIAVQAPAGLGAVGVGARQAPAAPGDLLPAALDLVLDAQLVLRLGRVAGIDGDPEGEIILSRPQSYS